MTDNNNNNKLTPQAAGPASMLIAASDVSSANTALNTGTVAVAAVPAAAQQPSTPTPPALVAAATAAIATGISTSTNTTTTTKAAAPAIKVPVANAMVSTYGVIGDTIARFAWHQFGTWLIMDDPYDGSDSGPGARVSKFRVVLLRLSHQHSIGVASEGLLVLSLRIALHVGHSYSDKLSVMIDRPKDIASYGGKVANLSIDLFNDVSSTDDMEICSVSSIHGWEQVAVEELCKKFNEHFRNNDQPLTCIKPRKFVPNDICDALAAGAEMMGRVGCLIHNQSAAKECANINMQAADSCIDRKSFRFSGTQLVLNHGTMIVEDATLNAKNSDWQIIKTVMSRGVIPLKIGKDVLLVSVDGASYGGSFPQKEIILSHDSRLTEIIAALENLKNAGDDDVCLKVCLKLRDVIRNLQGRFSTDGEKHKFWSKLTSKLSSRKLLETVLSKEEAQRRCQKILDTLYPISVYVKVLLCAGAASFDSKPNGELLTLLSTVLNRGFDNGIAIVWSLLGTLTRTWDKHEACDLLAWGPHHKGTDGKPLLSAKTKQAYMAADLEIMQAAVSTDVSGKEKALLKSEALDVELGNAHKDYLRRCDTIRDDCRRELQLRMRTQSTLNSVNSSAINFSVGVAPSSVTPKIPAAVNAVTQVAQVTAVVQQTAVAQAAPQQTTTAVLPAAAPQAPPKQENPADKRNPLQVVTIFAIQPPKQDQEISDKFPSTTQTKVDEKPSETSGTRVTAMGQ